MSDRLLEIADLTVTRPGAAPALDRFSLTLEAGERLVLLGETGSGKEALISVLGGFTEKSDALSGTLRFKDGEPRPAAGRAPAPIRIAYLFNPVSHPLAAHVALTAQLSRIVANRLDMPIPGAREELRQALQRMPGSPPLEALDRKPRQLDPVAVMWGLFAAVSAQKPDLVLADHPLADMAPSAMRSLLLALGEEQKRAGFALIYATDGLQPVARLGGRVVVIRHGHVVEEGDAVRLAGAQAHAYTRTLFQALPRLILTHPRSRPGTRGQPLLQVHSLALGGDAKKRARPGEAITFELRRGASLALVGEDGSGRRALLRAVLGLDRAPAGRVVFDAVDLSVLSRPMSWRLRRRVAFVSGMDDLLDPRMTVWDTVDEPLRAHLHLSNELIAGYRDAALKRVGLGTYDRWRTVETLSTFDKRRLQVARAMVAAPLLAVIDEPMRGLDATAQTVMREVLADFRTSQGPAFLVVTADFTVAQAFADEAMVFKDGKVVEQGPIVAMLKGPQHAATRALINAVILPGLSKKPQQG